MELHFSIHLRDRQTSTRQASNPRSTSRFHESYIPTTGLPQIHIKPCLRRATCAGLRDKYGILENAGITRPISQRIGLIGARRPMLEAPCAPTRRRRLRPRAAVMLLGTTVLSAAAARKSLPLIPTKTTMLELAARAPLRLINLQALPLELNL